MKIYVKASSVEQKLFATLPEWAQEKAKSFRIFYPTRFDNRQYILKLDDGRYWITSSIKDLREILKDPNAKGMESIK